MQIPAGSTLIALKPTPDYQEPSPLNSYRKIVLGLYVPVALICIKSTAQSFIKAYRSGDLQGRIYHGCQGAGSSCFAYYSINLTKYFFDQINSNEADDIEKTSAYLYNLVPLVLMGYVVQLAGKTLITRQATLPM